MEVKMTYMDTRFLVLDLEVTIRDLDEEARVIAAAKAKKLAEKEAELQKDMPEEVASEDSELVADQESVDHSHGNVSVTVDGIAQPGLMASGRVTFSDGNAAMWYIDERGLGLNPDVEGYQPNSSDIEAFQLELQMIMDKQ